MGDNGIRWQAPAMQDITKQSFERRHLGFWVGRVGVQCCRIDEFNADRTRVDVITSAPLANASVPSPMVFVYQAPDSPVTRDEVMCRDFGVRIAQAFQGRLVPVHRSIVQNDQFRPNTKPTGSKVGARMV